MKRHTVPRVGLLALMTGVLLLAFSVPSVVAEENGEQGSSYLPMEPSFILNLGGPDDGLHFVRADVTLRLNNPKDAETVEAHLNWLRHEMVMLLSHQDPEKARSGEGQEELREEALTLLNERLETQVGRAMLRDVLFTGFVVQSRR